MPEVAFHGGRGDSLALSQPAAVDAVQMLFIDQLAEGFTRSLGKAGCREIAGESSAHSSSSATSGLQEKNAPAASEVFMAHLAGEAIFLP